MNEEMIEDRHYRTAARRSREARKEAADRIVRKAQELADLMSDLGQYGIQCEVEFHETTAHEPTVLGQDPSKADRHYMYHTKVRVAEPPVILGSTPPTWVR